MRASIPRVRDSRRLGLVLCALFAVVFSGSSARALVIEAPIGGDTITLPEDRVVCSASAAPWSVDASKKRVRPPASGHAGDATSIAVAPSGGSCAAKAETVTLVATGALPTVDPQSVVASIDAGKLEIRGDGLEGVRIAWNADSVAGSDACVNVGKDKGHDVCDVNIDSKLPANPLHLGLRWIPPGGKLDPNTIVFDRTGNGVAAEQLRLIPARVLLGRIFPPSRTADVASGVGKIQLLHPEAVSSAECTAGRCELSGGELVVRAVPVGSTTISVRLHLLPRIFIARGDVTDSQVTETLTVLRCPLTIVSGQPLRDVDDLGVLVRLDKACNQDVDQLRWTASGEPAEVTRTANLADGVYALLHIGRLAGDHVTIVALRSDDGSVIAVATERTWAAPPLVTSLGLPGYGQIEFIPKNRDALLSIAPVSTTGNIVPISVAGAYTVEHQTDGWHVRGAYTSGGFTSLRFAYRATNVPAEFSETNLATLVDPVQRPIREASVPAPLGASSITKHPIVELICAFAKGKLFTIESGTSPHIPFSQRDTCRLVIHRDRIPLEAGAQRLDIEVSVTSVSGNERGDAKLAQHLVLRHGPDELVIWIRGAKEQFDRISVRVTHVIDETEYLSGATGKVELPSAQWTVVTENAHLRFYATAAIPAGLYRFSKDPQDLGSGPLALNFGILSRLTWLDHEGHDGIVGLETGMMAMGLETDKTRQLAFVLGLGVSVPLGNVNQPTQASINIHAWSAYTFGNRFGTLTDDEGKPTGTVKLNPWAFVFGPSITIGNIGTFL